MSQEQRRFSRCRRAQRSSSSGGTTLRNSWRLLAALHTEAVAAVASCVLDGARRSLGARENLFSARGAKGSTCSTGSSRFCFCLALALTPFLSSLENYSPPCCMTAWSLIQARPKCVPLSGGNLLGIRPGTICVVGTHHHEQQVGNLDWRARQAGVRVYVPEKRPSCCNRQGAFPSHED